MKKIIKSIIGVIIGYGTIGIIIPYLTDKDTTKLISNGIYLLIGCIIAIVIIFIFKWYNMHKKDDE